MPRVYTDILLKDELTPLSLSLNLISPHITWFAQKKTLTRSRYETFMNFFSSARWRREIKAQAKRAAKRVGEENIVLR